MEFWVYLLAFLGSLLAGGINTLAGNGSAITLTILTDLLGLPGNLANGTNRLGVWTQATAGSYAFFKAGKLDLRRSKGLLSMIVLGALAGVWVATHISHEGFREVFHYLLLVFFFVILLRPSRWLRETDAAYQPNPWIAMPLALALGFYGGFIQMGMGILFLALAVLGARYSLVEANALKLFVIAIYMPLVIFVFHHYGFVDWKIGGLMAAGQTLGGYVTARYAAESPRANKIAWYVLLMAVGAAVIRWFWAYG